MIDYEKLYKALFNKITDAIKEMDNFNYGSARDSLVSAQQQAEDSYINMEE